MMKRIVTILALVLVTAFAILLLAPRGSRSGPRYVPGKVPFAGNYTSTHYDWISARPFVDDKVWIFGRRNRTNMFFYLYDLRERMILGELLQGGGVTLVNQDGTKVLCLGPDSPSVSARAALANLLQRISGGKIGAGWNRMESLWLVDIKNNSSKRVGAASQYTGTGSRWYSSPGLRYGCTMPTAENNAAFLVFDFEKDKFTRVALGGHLIGWWDEQNVLLQNGNHDFILYDVLKQQKSVLFDADYTRQTLNELMLPGKPADLTAFANWNGREYDFYFAEKDYDSKAKQCFLLKAQRPPPKPTLKLVSPQFKFEWGGHLDAQATRFLYQGESGAAGRGGNGAVYLRDLRDNSVRTLVPPDNKGQYSIPRFYGDEVIYFRNRVLWRIGLDGSNDTPLFPTTNSPAKL